jgi:hypothetical protein
LCFIDHFSYFLIADMMWGRHRERKRWLEAHSERGRIVSAERGNRWETEVCDPSNPNWNVNC